MEPFISLNIQICCEHLGRRRVMKRNLGKDWSLTAICNGNPLEQELEDGKQQLK